MASSATNFGNGGDRPLTPFVGHRWSSFPDDSTQDEESAPQSGDATPANSVAEPLSVGYDTDEESQELQAEMRKLIVGPPKYPPICIIRADIVNDYKLQFSVKISNEEKVVVKAIDSEAKRDVLRGNGDDVVVFCVNGVESEKYRLSDFRGHSLKIKVYQIGFHVTCTPCRSLTPPPLIKV